MPSSPGIRGDSSRLHPNPHRNSRYHRPNLCHRQEPNYRCFKRSGMAQSYWTHCMQCHEMICGVEVLEEYPIAGALLRTQPATKATHMKEQLLLLQEGKAPQKYVPIYRVTLVREGQMPSYEQRLRSSA